VADAFSKSATAKIEAAGGSAHVLEFPTGDFELADSEAEIAPSEEVATPAAPAKEKKAPKAAPAVETLPPTSSADEAGSEA
jgi:hypothetical protein